MAKIQEIKATLPKPPILNPAPKLPPSFATAFGTASAINGLPLTSVTSAQLQKNSNEAVTSLIADIGEARETVHVAYYIWLNDTNGTRMAIALIDAAKRGVLVRAMVDAVGSENLIHSSLWREMARLG